MNYDRQITISVGNNRRDMVWKQTVLTVEELYKRLSTPVRGTETLQDYLHLKKSQQDDLKDVGGFVGGSLLGQRRKANNVTGRDIITLDFDNIPGWQTETIIGKMDELGFSYCIYSTRKHTPERPRLRVVVPTDRTNTSRARAVWPLMWASAWPTRPRLRRSGSCTGPPAAVTASLSTRP